MNKALGREILWDNLVFTDFKAEVSGNTAIASVVESYTYYIADGFDSESFRRKMYTFELLLDSNGWKITNVTTDDPWEVNDESVTGTAGSRSKTDVKIAAHTSATNSAYETVSSYTTEPMGSFGRASIWRGYYSVQQP